MNWKSLLFSSRYANSIRNPKIPIQCRSCPKFTTSSHTQPAARVTSCQISRVSSLGPVFIDSVIEIDEGTLPGYFPERYYPVRIGGIFKYRYLVITKPGFDATSTVWLCRDLHENRYLTPKAHAETTRPVPEVEIAKYLNGINAENGGEKSMRLIPDSFQVEGPNGVHSFLLYPPAGMKMTEFLHRPEDTALPKYLHRVAVRIVLSAIHYLHQA